MSGEYAQLYLYDVSVSEVQACSGGLVYSRSSLTLVNGGSFSNISAHSGGLLALVAVLLIEIVNIASTHAISAVAAGGALVLNECPQVKLQICSCMHVCESCVLTVFSFPPCSLLRRSSCKQT